MKEQPKEVTHPRDGKVWINPFTESLRKEECLCLHCGKLNPKGEYRLTSDIGDFVLMPNGLIGKIVYCDYPVGGCCKEIRIRPFTNWFRRLILNIARKTTFFDADINDLKPICPAARSLYETCVNHKIALMVTRCPK